MASSGDRDDEPSFNCSDSICSYRPNLDGGKSPPSPAATPLPAPHQQHHVEREYELSDIFYTSHKKGVFRVQLNEYGFQLERETAAGVSKTQTVRLADIIGGRCMRMQKTQPLQRRLSGACACTSASSSSSAASAASSSPSSANSTALSTPSKVGGSGPSSGGGGGDDSAYLYVFAYVLKKNLRCTLRRERTVLTLRFRSFDSFEMNMREAERWQRALQWHKTNELLRLHGGVPVPSRRRLLVLLNPKSGAGKARQQFHQLVVPVLNEADMPFDLYVTKHANYAREFVQTRHLAQWSGVVAVGGDGLFFEILNGLLERPDWLHVLQRISLGIVPCGSGNGLAKSLAHSFNEPYDPKPIVGAALTVIGGRSVPMDVVRVELKNHIMYSFLSIGWGLISDIDIESEHLRALGYQRFTLWTLYRLIGMRTYRGKVSYVLQTPPDTSQNPAEEPSFGASMKHSQSYSVYLNQSLKPPVAGPTACANHQKRQSIDTSMNLNSGVAGAASLFAGALGDFDDVISLETSVNYSFRSRCDSWFSAGSRKSTYYSIAESLYHSVGGDSADLMMSAGGEGAVLAPPQATVCPPLHEPLSHSDAEWISEEGEFIMVQAAYQTHLGIDCYFAPSAQLNDGLIYLVIIRAGISRSQLLQFLIGMSSGTHIPTKHNDYIKQVAVRAFRLEPARSEGILTVDGERVEFGPLQAEVLPGIAKVMVPK